MQKKATSSRQRLLHEFWPGTTTESSQYSKSKDKENQGNINLNYEGPTSTMKEDSRQLAIDHYGSKENRLHEVHPSNGSSQYTVGSSNHFSQFSQDEMEFLTPQDQPVVHVSNPSTPSPIKKRHRLTIGGILQGCDEDMVCLTQDMDVLDVCNAEEGGMQDDSVSRSSDEDNQILHSNRRHFALSTPKPRKYPACKQGKSLRNSQNSTRLPLANTNPFSIDRSSEKRKRIQTRQPIIPCANAKLNAGFSRYLYDFVELEEIGRGSFSRVFKCLKRIDGCLYAVKKCTRRVFGRAERERVLREVYALSSLAQSQYVVRYYNAWFEDDCLYIQLEYCPGGNFDEKAKEKSNDGVDTVPCRTEEELLHVLHDVTSALKDIHEANLVHLDVKPSNILIASNGYCKIADFGQVSKADGSMDVVEGDNRYLSRELLQGNRENLIASDIFALGATLYELALGRGLNGCGDEWQDIRNGKLTDFPQLSSELKELIALMMHPNPLRRPTEEEILSHHAMNRFLLTRENKTQML